MVTQGSQPTGKAIVKVPIARTEEVEYDLRASIDWNKNGTMEESEQIVTDLPFTPKRGDFQTLAVALPEDATETSSYTVLLAVFKGSDTSSTESLETEITLGTYDIGDVLDMSTVTNPESAMKGQTVVRNAKPPAPPKPEGVPTNFGNDTPDLKQRKDECAPTSAANSIIRMAGDNGKIDAIPRDPYELVDLLKREMGWTYQNGVLVEDFSRGKDFVAKQLNLPIHSETITGDFNHVLDGVEETLNQGGGTEIRMKQVVQNPQTGRNQTAGGHMITVTRVIRTGQQVSVQVHDPLSPSGTDTYDVDARTGELINYPYMRGSLIITTGFLQHWSKTESIMDDLEPTHRETIKVIDYQGKKIPLSEVHVGEHEACGAFHYHANRGGAAKALDGTMVPDPDPNSCGYGKVDDVPVEDCSRDGKTCTRVPQR